MIMLFPELVISQLKSDFTHCQFDHLCFWYLATPVATSHQSVESLIHVHLTCHLPLSHTVLPATLTSAIISSSRVTMTEIQVEGAKEQ